MLVLILSAVFVVLISIIINSSYLGGMLFPRLLRNEAAEDATEAALYIM